MTANGESKRDHLTSISTLNDDEIATIANEFDSGREIRDLTLRALDKRTDRRSLVTALSVKAGGAALLAALGVAAHNKEAGAWSPATYVTPICCKSYPVTCWVGQGGHVGSLNYWAIDIGTPTGTPVYATKSGYAYRVWDSKSGNMVLINHNDGLQTMLAHLSGFSVANGSWVTGSYTRVGTSGASGAVSGPHLHWGLRIQGTQQSVDIRGVPGVSPSKIYP